jgi:phytoene synthase
MSDDASDLDALIRRVDPDRWLSSRFIADLQARADVVALYAFDHELARAPKVASNPLLGEIRLTWWREVLDEAFEGRAVRRHPTAQALADAVRRRGLPREPLEAMVDARYRELDPAPMSEAEALDWARDTGGQAAVLAAGVLDPAGSAAGALPAGAVWSLGRRAAAAPGLKPAFDELRAEARLAVRRLGVAAFPAVAHAALAGAPGGSELAKRLRITLAVARGRI